MITANHAETKQPVARITKTIYTITLTKPLWLQTPAVIGYRVFTKWFTKCGKQS